MTTTPLKLYQIGTFAAGNRLLDPSERTVQSCTDRANSITSGHRACRGCGEALAARVVLDAAMRATGGRLVTVNATGCLEVFSTPYPESAWQVPWLHSLFGNAAAVASGVAAALRATGPRRRPGASRRQATAAPSTSGSAASRGCSSATTTCSSSATTTRAT